MALSQAALRSLARAGAETRIRELQGEIESIYRAFPDLQRGRRGARGQAGKQRRRRGWTAAQRKAAAERMRKYWAARNARKK
jgi:hypothetical protein